ncbi:MAG: hypothetical protein JO133_03745 [Burkholderiaceae bacterium]|nr:hypothetical protein [Burkholderiaceae bacterium]
MNRTGRFRDIGSAAVATMLVGATLALAGCDRSSAQLAQALRETQPPYPIVSSGLVFGFRMVGPDPVYWLDDDHVLFPGYEVIPPKGPFGHGRGELSEPGLYVWDIKTNMHVRHASLESPMWKLCYSDGYIFYSTRHGDNNVSLDRYAGPFGQEELLVNDPTGAPAPEGRKCFDSKWPRESYQRTASGAVGTILLRPGDGEIEFGGGTKLPRLVDRQNQMLPIRLIRTESSTPIELPIVSKEVTSFAGGEVSFAPFLNRYVLVAATPRSRDVFDPEVPWPANQPVPVYLIAPDGKVAVEELPAGIRKPSRVFPTRAGLFWVSNDAPSGNSLQAGGWLLKDGKPQKLFDHIVTAAGVSPDGCRIVYAVNDFSASHFRFLTAINVCQP